MITDHIENRFHIGSRIQHYGATATAIATGASVLISAAGTGLSMMAQQSQADQAEAMANYNYKVAQINADINARTIKLQSEYQARAAENEYQTRQNNAAQLEAQGRGVEAQAREKARRMREEHDAQKAMIRSRYAKSGVTSEGTPLMVMAKNAALLELAVQDGSFQAEMQARALDRQAGNERAGAEFSLFDKYMADYEAAAAEAGQAIDLNVAAANRAAGLSQAQGYRASMYGTLLSGVGDVIATGAAGYEKYSKWNALKPSSSTTSPTKPRG